MDEIARTLEQAIDLLHLWPIRIALVLLGALVLDALQRRVLKRLTKRAGRKQRIWRGALLRALSKPLALLIWVCAIALAARTADRQMTWDLFGVVAPFAGLGVIAAFAWFALRATTNVKQNLLQHGEAKGKPLDTTTVDAVTKIVVVCIVILAFIFTLQNFGFSVSGLLAFGGLGALAIGMAAKDLLANFFGGWMIYLTRPFSVGDWVRSPDREIEGTVERIGWCQTRVRAFDQRPLFVPNSIFSNVVLVNPSRMTHRQLYEIIGVRHTDVSSLGKIVADVEQYLRSHEELDQDQTVMAYFDQLTPNALNFFIYAFTRSIVWADYQRIKQDVLFKVAAIIETHGAQIGQPVATVRLTGDAPGKAPRQTQAKAPQTEDEAHG